MVVTEVRSAQRIDNHEESSPGFRSASITRLVVCGSVDDGKSTLIGHLLAATNSVPMDQVEAARSGHGLGSPVPEGAVDYSLLTDGLEAERQQGITIDVAHRHLMLPSGRRLIIADAPGHEQYTRNMAVAASSADVALLVVDARSGMRTQSHRHLAVSALMGVKAVVVCVNKMDAVDFDSLRYRQIADRATDAASRWGIGQVLAVPVSATRGDNVVDASRSTPYYSGPTLLEVLDGTANETDDLCAAPFRLSIQHVVRHDTFRGCSGTVSTGRVRVGDRIRVAQRSTHAAVAAILGAGGPIEEACAGDPVIMSLSPEIDTARGDVLVAADDDSQPSGGFRATLVWVSDEPLAHGRSYLIVSGGQMVPAVVTTVCHRIDLGSGAEVPARRLATNDIGDVEINADQPVFLDPYTTSKHTGGFVVVDRVTGDTVAAGMVRGVLQRTVNIRPHCFSMDRWTRAEIKHQRPLVLWLTGLSGAGKSSIADALETRLHASGVHTYVLDGDNLRVGLTKDLGFSPEDRAENARRVSETARLMLDAGLVVIVALVSPFSADRLAARERFEPGDFIEVWVDTPLEVCRQRDAKGLYARSAGGELGNLTGIGQRYEAPEHPEIRVDGRVPLEDTVRQLEEIVLSRCAVASRASDNGYH